MRLFAHASAGAGLIFMLAAFATPTSFVECNAIDFDDATSSLVCDGECQANSCREITHNTGVTFCGCDEEESLPECCELARNGNSVTTVGDCPSCQAEGDCVASPCPQPCWREYQAKCTGSDQG